MVIRIKRKLTISSSAANTPVRSLPTVPEWQDYGQRCADGEGEKGRRVSKRERNKGQRNEKREGGRTKATKAERRKIHTCTVNDTSTRIFTKSNKSEDFSKSLYTSFQKGFIFLE